MRDIRRRDYTPFYALCFQTPQCKMSTVISCPGKVLLAGGYLVLDPHHQGFVVSTPSRFYTVVQQVEAAGITPSTDEIEITVNSPQFDDGQWKYKAVREQGEEWKVREVKAEG